MFDLKVILKWVVIDPIQYLLKKMSLSQFPWGVAELTLLYSIPEGAHTQSQQTGS